jgi:protein-tyrosine phosphatase
MLLNLRDAGGHPTESGGRLREGVLYRGDAPLQDDHDAAEALSALGLRTIVDLRRDIEREKRPYALPAFDGRFVRISLVGDERRPVNALTGGLAQFNRWVYAERGGTIVEIVRALAHDASLPALVHCTAGKDRTGLVVALLQSWLGVADDVVAADYALSAERLHVDDDEAIEKQQIALGVNVRDRPDLLDARPEWMLDALAAVREEHGTVENYLLAQGASPEELARLREALLES